MVLNKARKPLTIKELSQRILEEGLFQPSGRTPERSLYAIILRANRRVQREGQPQKFLSHKTPTGRVHYTLNTKS